MTFTWEKEGEYVADYEKVGSYQEGFELLKEFDKVLGYDIVYNVAFENCRPEAKNVIYKDIPGNLAWAYIPSLDVFIVSDKEKFNQFYIS